jgi:hypothetical protein
MNDAGGRTGAFGNRAALLASSPRPLLFDKDKVEQVSVEAQGRAFFVDEIGECEPSAADFDFIVLRS